MAKKKKAQKTKRSCLLVKKKAVVARPRKERRREALASTSRVLEREARERMKQQVKPATSLNFAPASLVLPKKDKWLFDFDTTPSRKEARQRRRQAPHHVPTTDFSCLPVEGDEEDECLLDDDANKDVPLFIPLAPPTINFSMPQDDDL